MSQPGSGPGSAPGTLFTWFRDTASRYPSQVALEVAGETLRYRDLLNLAERLATRLVAAAGGRPSAVGLLAGRSATAYAGYLAALRLAATVVPLNTSFPLARNLRICQSAGVDVVLADPAGAAQLREMGSQSGAASVVLDPGGDGRSVPLQEMIDCEPWSRPYDGDPDAIAYVLYTSGSTGEPKGIPIRHRNLADLLPFCARRYETGPGSRFSQNFDLTFDVSVYDMFIPWYSGAAVIVPQVAELLNPARFVTTRRLTHWVSVPSVISVSRRLRLLRPGSMPDLRWSVFGGEQVTYAQAAAWATAAPNSIIENFYGPTEVTISAVAYVLPADQASWPPTSNETVPIGKPYPHMQTMIVTEDGRPGEEGELLIRGSQRSSGYAEPANNRGRFASFDGTRAVAFGGAPVPAEHWFRSGDRVRREGGQLVHLGRMDNQVQVRGYRVEPGEIESVLRAHPELDDVVVLGLPAADEIVLHAAYTGRRVDPAELSALARRRLPPYMVPEHYRHLDEFPLNTNGKTDRVRLARQLAEQLEGPRRP
jgi:amino acid adenylation domain-containing protein